MTEGVKTRLRKDCGRPERTAISTDRSRENVPVYDFSKEQPKHAMERRVYPEVKVCGFPHNDQEVMFFSQVAAILQPNDQVLDFGAGRGEFIENDPSAYRVRLKNFRGRCARVYGCDPDACVLENPSLDCADVIEIGERLPYEDGQFDLIVSRHVFEHVTDPGWVAGELLRVLKAGGWICAMTPNKWGYVAVASRLLPNRFHAGALSSVQPGRPARDVFPTAYRLNRPAAVRRYFGHAADVYHYSHSGIPSYYFGSLPLMRLQQLAHRLIPPAFEVGLRFFIQKRVGKKPARAVES